MVYRSTRLASVAAAGIFALSAGLVFAPVDNSALAQGGPPDHANPGGNSGNAGGPDNNNGNQGNNGNNGNPGGGPPAGVGGGNGAPGGSGGGNGPPGGLPEQAGGNGLSGNEIRDAYNNAGGNGNGNGRPDDFGPRGVGQEVLVLDETETEALLNSGWGANVGGEGDFRNHGERVRTMVAIARELGYSAHVGALQANFGTRQENFGELFEQIEQLESDPLLSEEEANALIGDSVDTTDVDVTDPQAVLEAYAAEIEGLEPQSGSDLEALLQAYEDALPPEGEQDETEAALQAYIDELQAAQETRSGEIEAIEDEIEETAENVKPGDGPQDGWEFVDLDVNGDGVVDANDLQ